MSVAELELDEVTARAAFAEACPGVAVRATDRVAAGYTTRHWLLHTADGPLLLKVPVRNTDPRHLHHLVRATTVAATAGVPVPRYRALLDHCAAVGRPVLVQEYLPGTSASHAWPGLDPARRERIAAEFGTAVGRLHTIGGTGFTDLAGGGAAPSWADHVRRRATAALRELVGSAVAPGAGWGRVERELLGAVDQLAADIPPVFTHNDLYLDNVLVDGGALRCVLDFEHSRYNDRYADFGKLGELVFGWFPETAAPFVEAYRDLHPPAADEPLRLRVSDGLHDLTCCAYFHRWTPGLVPAYLSRIDAWLQET